MTFRNLFESKFKDQLIEKYEVIIRKGYKELVVEIDLPASTRRWTFDSNNIKKINDFFDVNMKAYYWNKKQFMVNSLEKLIKPDEIEINRIK